MTIPLWSLLAFACWTLLFLLVTVGYYRWSRILTGRSEIKVFQAGQFFDDDAYRRWTRAHANCVENLPVYASIVLLMHITGVQAAWIDWLAIGFMAARIVQSLVHASFRESNLTVAIRFSFFLTQFAIMIVFAVAIVLANLN